jgi:putative transposase
MARLKRLFIRDVSQHLIVRGNDRQDIFTKDADRYYFLGCLEQAAKVNGMAIHAYVLMDNHVHLLASGDSWSSIPRTIQSLGRRYVAHFNHLYDRTGTLWEGRYKSALVQAEGYLLNCHRYIELNPVRARMVSHPAAYRWSSHGRLALGLRDDLVTPHPMWEALGAGDAQSRQAYGSLFSQAIPDEIVEQIRDATHHGWAVGDADFLDWAGTLCNRRAKRTRARRGEGKGRKR